MLFKRFGRTDIQVSSIGLGLNIADPTRSIPPESQVELIRLAGTLGITLLDTAPTYGSGRSEELVGEAIRDRREQFFVATKVPPEETTYKGLLEAADASLGRLKTGWIDLYQVHWPNPSVPLSETMRAMEALVRDGKVRHVGVSNFSMSELREAEACFSPRALGSVQVEYNLFDRTIESDLLPFCRQRGMTAIAYSPLHRGTLAGNAEGREVLRAIAERHGCTSAQVALRWLTAQEAVVPIPNTTNPSRLLENSAAADLDLSAHELERIGRCCRVDPVPVPTDSIRVADDTGRQVYTTLKQALENPLGFVPSPVQLAEQIRNGDFLKPVRVRPAANGRDGYELMEGRIRYWAWVIAHRGKDPIPALVDEQETG
jgi:aryl-alcohol dehydrogenase-like predicted oxidoreductase